MPNYTVEVEAVEMSDSGMNAEMIAQWSGCGTAQAVASHVGGLMQTVLLLTPCGQLTVMNGDTVVRMGNTFAVFPAQTFETFANVPAAGPVEDEMTTIETQNAREREADQAEAQKAEQDRIAEAEAAEREAAEAAEREAAEAQRSQ